MSATTFSELKEHVGHNTAVVVYGDNQNVAIECEDCGEVLIDFDNDDQTSSQKSKKTDVLCHCTYCGKSQVYHFEENRDFETFEDVLEYDYEMVCEYCGCNFRINEAADPSVLKEYGFKN